VAELSHRLPASLHSHLRARRSRGIKEEFPFKINAANRRHSGRSSSLAPCLLAVVQTGLEAPR